MFFFKKKSKEKKDISTDPADLQTITENLYKQGFELSIKNKTLSYLGELYGISILNLAPYELAQQITVAIQKGLEFDLVGIYLYDKAHDSAQPLHVALSSRTFEADQHTKENLEKTPFKSISKIECLLPVLINHTVGYTEDLGELWTSIFPESIHQIQDESHIRSVIVYPLIIQKETIGFFIVGLNRVLDQLSDSEKESIRSFVNVIAVALDKSLVYEKLQVTNKKLEEVNQGQESLIHVINHQIKGYLTIAKNVFAELLNTDDYGKMPDDAKIFLQKGLSTVDEGTQYVQSVLRAMSAREGTLQYNMQKIDVASVFTKVTDQQKEIAEAAGLSFHSYIMPDDSFETMGDELQLAEALKNLITNAIKYNSEHGEINVELLKKGRKISFSVRDTGVGIDEGDKELLFTPGGMGKNAISVNSDSSGYGLSFVKDVVTAHGGTVKFASNKPKKGTTFFVELPIKKRVAKK